MAATNTTAADTVGVNTKANTDSFLAQLYTAVPLFFVITIGYIFLRYCIADKLEVRRSKPQVSHPTLTKKSFFKWICEIYKISDIDYYRYAGIDAFIFLLFLRNVLKICVVCLPFALIILIPIYSTAELNKTDALSRISLSNVAETSNRLYGSVVMLYVFVLIILYNFTQLYLKIAYIAREFAIGNHIECINNLSKIKWINFDQRTIDSVNESVDYRNNDLPTITIHNNNNNNNAKYNSHKNNDHHHNSSISSKNFSVDAASVSENDGNDKHNAYGSQEIHDNNVGATQKDNNRNNNNRKSSSRGTADSQIKDDKGGILNVSLNDNSNDDDNSSTSLSMDRYAGDHVKPDHSRNNIDRHKAGSKINRDASYTKSSVNIQYAKENMKIELFRYSIMITNLPPPFYQDSVKSDDKLRMFFQTLFPHQVDSVIVVPEISEIKEICDDIEEHDKELKEIEKSDDPDAKMKRGKCGCGEKYNAKEYHTNKRLKLISKYNELVNHESNYQRTPVAFITFDNFQSVAVASGLPIRFGSSTLKISRCDLNRPDDILWHNLKYQSYKTLKAKRSVVKILFILLLLFWSIPSAAIQGLANIRSIFDRAGINIDNYLPSEFVTWLEGYLSVALLHIWLTLVPFIVEIYVTMEFHTSNGTFNISCMRKYYDCLLFMLLLVTAISGSVLTNINAINDININKWLRQFALGLSEVSTYFASYVMYTGLVSVPLQLFRIGYWVQRLILKSENNEWDTNWNDWAICMIMFSIVICYCVMAPFIFIVGILYFIIYIFVFKYTSVMCSFNIKHEYGSYSIFTDAFTKIMVALYISILTLIILMALRKAFIPFVCLLPLFIIVGVFHYSISSFFDRDFKYSHINGAQRQDYSIIDTPKSNLAYIRDYYVPPMLKRPFERKNQE